MGDRGGMMGVRLGERRCRGIWGVGLIEEGLDGCDGGRCLGRVKLSF